MLGANILLTMFQYNHQINRRLLDLAGEVTPEQWDAPQEAGQRSLHETLFHLLVVEEEYLHLCRYGKPIWESRQYADFPNAELLRVFNQRIYETYAPYFEGATDDQLTGKVTSDMPSGRVESVMIWHILLHMFYHSAQHRSECAYMLTRYGHSPGFIDFYGFGNWGAD